MNENENIEWKTSWRDEYLKWICGFANAQGGVLEIGKSDRGEVVGVADASKLLVDLPNKIRDMLGIVPEVNLLKEHGKDVIRITVEPYPYPVSYKGQYHVRSGSTKQELRGAALDHFLLRKTGRHWDAVPIPGVSPGDLDPGVISRFRERATRSKRLGPEILEEEDEVLIEKLRLTDGEYLKREAVLLFHPDPEAFVTGAFVKIGYFESHSELRYQDEIHGDLFTQVDKTMDLLLTKYMKAVISYEGVQRVETYPVPEEALREAVLNAIAHKDYGSAVPIQISVYDDKIMLWNP
jgi:ATP-dependent DNA helicase RecG